MTIEPSSQRFLADSLLRWSGTRLYDSSSNNNPNVMANAFELAKTEVLSISIDFLCDQKN